MNFAYNVEILPYNLRTKGMAMWSLVNALALCSGIWINSVALAAIAWKWYIFYIGVDTYLILVIIFLFPETKGWVGVLRHGADILAACRWKR